MVSPTRHLFVTSLIIVLLGWWLCKNTKTNAEGWTPSAYVEEIQVEARPAPPPPPPAAPARPVPGLNGTNGIGAAKAKPTPPAPPAKRPTPGGRKPVAPPMQARDSAVSLGTGSNSGTDSGRATPNSLAGGLAEALRARQSAMQGRKEEEDDW